LNKTQILVNAVFRRNFQSFLSLLENGISPNSKYRGFSILSWAAQEGCYKMCEILIKHGANVNYKDKDGITPLYQAVGSNHLKIVSLLLKNNAEVDPIFVGGGKVTPLHIASAYSYYSCVKLLLKYGANPRIKDEKGNYPITFAKRHKHKTIVEILDQYKGT
jgi:ankyrin repeat protein